MKFYSDVTKKLYDSEKELVDAETKVKQDEEAKAAEAKKKNEMRATRAKEVQDALKAATVATDKAQDLLKKFIHDYGYFHASYSLDDVKDNFSFNDIINNFLSFF